MRQAQPFLCEYNKKETTHGELFATEESWLYVCAYACVCACTLACQCACKCCVRTWVDLQNIACCSNEYRRNHMHNNTVVPISMRLVEENEIKARNAHLPTNIGKRSETEWNEMKRKKNTNTETETLNSQNSRKNIVMVGQESGKRKTYGQRRRRRQNKHGRIDMQLVAGCVWDWFKCYKNKKKNSYAYSARWLRDLLDCLRNK